MRTRTLITLALASVALAAPTQASAATLWTDGDELRYTAGAGEANQVNLSLQPPHGFVLQEDGVRDLTAIAPCQKSTFAMLPGTGGTCPPAGVERVLASLGDGHDKWSSGFPGFPIPVQLFGGGGNDALDGTGFADVVVAGSGEDDVESLGGDDIVYANDGQADSVTCGDGADSVASDPVDTVAADCETSFAGAPPIVPSDVPSPPVEPAPPFHSTVGMPAKRPLRRSQRMGILTHVTCNRPCGVEARIVVTGKRGSRGVRTTFGTLGIGLAAGERPLWIGPTLRVQRLLHKLRGATFRLRFEVRDLTAAEGEQAIHRRLLRRARW